MNLETKYGVVMLKENIEKISAINKTFGRNQSLYVIEECSELIKELIKEQRGPDECKTIPNVFDEMCDVLLTISVLCHQYDFRIDDIVEHMNEKCERALRWWDEKQAQNAEPAEPIRSGRFSK